MKRLNLTADNKTRDGSKDKANRLICSTALKA